MHLNLIVFLGLVLCLCPICQQDSLDWKNAKGIKMFQDINYENTYTMWLLDDKFFWEEQREGPFYFLAGNYQVNVKGEMFFSIDTSKTLMMIDELNKRNYPFKCIFGYTMKEYQFFLYKDSMVLKEYNLFKEDTISNTLNQILK